MYISYNGRGGFLDSRRPRHVFLEANKEEQKEMTDRDIIRSELKKHLTEYVNSITSPDHKAGRNMYKCPLCGSGSHGGRNSNGAFSITKDGESWHCFSCNKGGDLFDLIGIYENLPDHNDQMKRAADLYGTTIATQKKTQGKEAANMQPEEKKPQAGQFDAYIKKCAAAAGKTDYFKKRGFSEDTIARFSLGYDESRAVIVIPYDRSNSYFITRSTQGKEFRKPPTEAAGTEPVYNCAALYSGQPCFVCESPLDAISIMQAGGAAAAIGGTGCQKLIEQVKAQRPAGTIILCFDNDTAGKNATETAAAALAEEGAAFSIAAFSLDQYEGEKKDANDLLRANEAQLKQDVKENIKTARKKAAFVSYKVGEYLNSGSYDEDISYFRAYQNRKTGFANIDKYLTLYPGLAALGGSASLGKSTFAVNLADNLIAAGETVLYFSLEQEPIELVTKSLARRLFIKDPLTTINNTDIKNGASNLKLQAVKREYAETADRFIIVRCSFTTTAEDIRDYVEAFIKDTGKRPVVFIDYLQLVSPPKSFRGDIRAATDHVVKLFKTMQLNNELLVIMISNFNRSSYVVPVSYEAFKETGMIEFTCDYVWGLQLSILEDESFYTKEGSKGGEKDTSIKAKKDAVYNANAQNPKEVEFVSLKSRNGKQSYKCFFKYYMAYDLFAPDLNSPHDRTRGGEFSEETEDDDEEYNPFTKRPPGVPVN